VWANRTPPIRAGTCEVGQLPTHFIQNRAEMALAKIRRTKRENVEEMNVFSGLTAKITVLG
jgi:hypothetical protein